MDFNNIIKLLMKTRNLKQADLCRTTNIPSSLMSEYVSGKKSPALNNAIAIANALGVSLDELTGRVELRQATLSEREETLLNKFRTLDERGKRTIELSIDVQLEVLQNT